MRDSRRPPLGPSSTLERLEEQIRQRVGGPNPPAVGDQPAVAPPTETPPTSKKLERGYLGVRVDDQRERGRGVRVLDVYHGSPAERAGLRRQDLITAVAGIRVRQITELSEILETLAPGQGVELEVLRDGRQQKLRATLAQAPAAGQSAVRPETVPPPPPEATAEPPEKRAGAAEGPASIPPPPEPFPLGREVDQPAGPQLQPPGAADHQLTDAARLEQLQRRVDELERRVAELEQQLAEALKKKPSP